MAGEKDVEYCLDSFMKDCDLFLKEKASLLVMRCKAVLECENSKLKEELRRNTMKCDELNVKIAKLVEEKRQIRDKEKMMEEGLQRSEMKCEELNGMIAKSDEEQNKIREMYEKVREQNAKLATENEEIMQKDLELEHRFRLLDVRAMKLEIEIKNSACKKLDDIQTIKELKRKLLEADEVNKDLKQQLEATRMVSESMQKKMEANKAVKLMERRAGKQHVPRDAVGTSPDLCSGFNAPPAEVTGAKEGNGSEGQQGLGNECNGLQRSGCSSKRADPSTVIEIRDSDDEKDDIPLSRVFGGLKDEDGSFSEDDLCFDSRQNYLMAKLESIAKRSRKNRS